MRSFLSILLFSLIVFSFISCNKDDSTSPNEEISPSAASYYPGAAGSTYTYSVKKDNVESGQRVVTFAESSEHGGIYLMQASVMDTTSISYFRRTDAGIYFFIDTTGLSGFIPDSLSGVVSLSLDQEVTALIKTFNTTKDWTAFKMDVKILTIPYNVVTVTAHYEVTENINLNFTSGSVTMEAQKIRYDMKYTVPNLTGGNPEIRNYTAYVWFVKDVGIAKLEGNATVLNAMGGSGIDFADTNKVISQSLISYSLK